MWNPGIVGRLEHVDVRVVASGGRRDTVLWYGATWQPAGVDLEIRRRRWASLLRARSAGDVEVGSGRERLVARSHAASDRLGALLSGPVRDALVDLAGRIGHLEIGDGRLDGSVRYDRLRTLSADEIVAAVQSCARAGRMLCQRWPGQSA